MQKCPRDGEGPLANLANQTIWTRDNLPIMRGLNSESVDLIYLDPPFTRRPTTPRPSEARPQARNSRTPGRSPTLTWHGLT